MSDRLIKSLIDLAVEAIEKREAHGEDCRSHWLTIAACRKRYGVTELVGKPWRYRGLYLPEDDATEKLLARVEAEPGEVHRVGEFISNNRAYHYRRKWSAAGFNAWTRCEGVAKYAVYATRSRVDKSLLESSHVA